MTKKFLYIFIASLFCCCYAEGQKTDSKAGEILQKARTAIFRQNIETKGFYLEYNSNYRSSIERKSKGYVDSAEQIKFWFAEPAKLKLRILRTYSDSDQELSEQVFNNGDYSKSSKIRSDDSGFSELAFTPNGDPQKIKEKNIAKLKYSAFTALFPITLKFDDELNFTYAGIAKSSEQSASIIETSLCNFYKIKLFFDSKTNLPLLIVANFYDEILKKDIEQKFFYSDFKEEKGLLYAHKIIVRENNEVVEEREVKLVAVNPPIKADFFEIKK